MHRLTNDLDTISSRQADLVEILLAEPGADRLDHAKVRLTTELPAVDIDVMDDTSEHPLPTLPGDRAFALARRYATATRERLTIVVTDLGRPVHEGTAPFASVAALVALKAVAMPRRASSNHPEKVASDIHDLDDLVERLPSAEPELAAWVATTLVRWFSPDARPTPTSATPSLDCGGCPVRSTRGPSTRTN